MIDEALAQSDFCLFDSNAPEISVNLCRQAHGLGKPIVFDMGSWKADADLFLSLASEVVASSACVPPDGHGSFTETARRHGISRFAITHGEGPIQWYEQEQAGLVHPPKTAAVDTLGAGDVYHGAYCYYRYHAALPFREALAKAADVAAKSVAYIGPRKGVIAHTIDAARR